MKKIPKLSLLGLLVVLLLTGCNQATNKIKIAGSATLAPITQAVIEDYFNSHKDAEISMSVSGTGGGFKRFTHGEIDINNASRFIKGNEVKDAQKNKVSYYTLTIANDALTVAVNKQNTWAKNLTTDQLRRIFAEKSGRIKWRDLNPSWPDEPIKIYGPGPDSGTYDFFVQQVMNKDNKMRADYTASEDANILVKGVIGDKYSIAFFGYVYYLENKDKLNAVAVNNVLPTQESVNNKTYTPLSRPLLLYVNKESYKKKKSVTQFVDYYLANAPRLVKEIGYVPLTKQAYQAEKDKLK